MKPNLSNPPPIVTSGLIAAAIMAGITRDEVFEIHCGPSVNLVVGRRPLAQFVIAYHAHMIHPLEPFPKLGRGPWLGFVHDDGVFLVSI